MGKDKWENEWNGRNKMKKMNKFELFTMIFYAIDLYYDNNPSDLLGRFLSGMNPFLFEDIGSADPAVYSEFCNIVQEEITVENSYNIAIKYIQSINYFDLDLVSAFQSITEEKWKEGCIKYYETNHKGKTLIRS